MDLLPPSGADSTIGGGELMAARITAFGPMPLGPFGTVPPTMKRMGPAVALAPVLSTTLSVAMYCPGGSSTVPVTPVAVALGVPSVADLITHPYATCTGQVSQVRGAENDISIRIMMWHSPKWH